MALRLRRPDLLFLLPLIIGTRKKYSINPHLEDAICLEFASNLREYTLTGALNCFWFHIPNESETSGKAANYRQCLKKDMGRIPGVSDYIFVGESVVLFIEMKSKTGTLTENQKLFRRWAQMFGKTVFVCRSVAEAEKVLIDNKLLEI